MQPDPRDRRTRASARRGAALAAPLVAALVLLGLASPLLSPLPRAAHAAEPGEGAPDVPEPVDGAAASKSEMRFTHSSGLGIEILQPGDGPSIAVGRTAVVHYTGWLATEGGGKGTKFDSTRDRSSVFTVSNIGEGRVIRGWNVGIPENPHFSGMKVGEKRRLLIPAKLAYGELGRPPLIPPDAPLVFEVELLEIR